MKTPPTRAVWVMIAFIALPPLFLALVVGLTVFGLLAVGLAAWTIDDVFSEPLAVVATNHSWRRAVAIEEFKHNRRSGWCDDIPDGAVIVATERRTKSTSRPAGRNKRTRHNRADWCTYDVDEWVLINELALQGESASPPPTWPEPPAQTCSTLGCQRPGARTETYTLALKAPDGRAHDCDLPQALWEATPDGAQRHIVIGGFGSPRCDSLGP